MTHNEAQAWQEFYRAHPFDDLHRFHRPAALVATVTAGGGRLQDRLDWLAPGHGMPEAQELADDAPTTDHEFSAADLATFKALGMKPPTRRH
jgi:hypothetical protein